MIAWRRTVIPAVALLLAAACAPGTTGSPSPLRGGELGVEILGVELLAGGDIARLNFRVVDYDIARKAFDQPVKLSTADGSQALDVMQAGRLGPLRQRPSRTGKKQFILFPNNGRPFVRGGKAVLHVGDASVQDIPVT
jgi:hypothetical protein